MSYVWTLSVGTCSSPPPPHLHLVCGYVVFPPSHPVWTMSVGTWSSPPPPRLDLVCGYMFFPSPTPVPMMELWERTHLWTKLHKGNIIPGRCLPGILHEEANGTGVPVWSWHVLLERALCEMNGPIVNLKTSNWECPSKIQDIFNKRRPIPFTAFMFYEDC